MKYNQSRTNFNQNRVIPYISRAAAFIFIIGLIVVMFKSIEVYRKLCNLILSIVWYKKKTMPSEDHGDFLQYAYVLDSCEPVFLYRDPHQGY